MIKKIIRNDFILCTFPIIIFVLLPILLHLLLRNYRNSYANPTLGIILYNIVSFLYAFCYFYMLYFFLKKTKEYHSISVVIGILESLVIFFIVPRYCRLYYQALYTQMGWISLAVAMWFLLYMSFFMQKGKNSK